MRTLAKVVVGSRLYGTATPNSDYDYKGVFLPEIRDVILGSELGNLPRSINRSVNCKDDEKNDKDSIDYELYSLIRFLRLAEEGQTVAIEMLFAPRNMCSVVSPEWEWLQDHRKSFLCRKMKSFLGYCRTQASKYSAKGGRMQAIENVIGYLTSFQNLSSFQAMDVRLGVIWDDLPIGEYIAKYIEPRNNKRMFSVCGRKFDETCCVQYVVEQLNKVKDGYGERAREAETNDGIDWKALSHAFRVGHQLKEILITGDLKFPLATAPFLKDVKLGKYNYQKDGIGEMLEKLLNDVEELSDQSSLPESIDMKPILDWVVMDVYGR